MEIRIIDRTRFEYHERNDEKYVIKTASGFEFPIPNYCETVRQEVGEGQTFEIEIEGNFPKANLYEVDKQSRVDVFKNLPVDILTKEGGHSIFDYVGYLSCKNIVTGEWGDPKSNCIDEDEVIRIVTAAEVNTRIKTMETPY